MTPMTVILQFCDPVVKSVQLLLQFLNFVLNRELPSGILISTLSKRGLGPTERSKLKMPETPKVSGFEKFKR